MTVATTVANHETFRSLPLQDWLLQYRPGAHNNLPYHLGPICEPCWLKHGHVTAVGVWDCPHR